jgi:hypothetical protein
MLNVLGSTPQKRKKKKMPLFTGNTHWVLRDKRRTQLILKWFREKNTQTDKETVKDK